MMYVPPSLSPACPRTLHSSPNTVLFADLDSVMGYDITPGFPLTPGERITDIF